VQRERASAAQRRLSVTLGVERDRTARRCGSGAKATGREWRKESAPAGARQGRRCRERRACDRERSWRMVVLGRRIARGGRERGAKPSPPATSGRSRSRSGTPERCPITLALTKPALAGVGALRGAPARMGRARRRLVRGERRFPGRISGLPVLHGPSVGKEDSIVCRKRFRCDKGCEITGNPLRAGAGFVLRMRERCNKKE
jgi:hypothetical protein